ncbi:MAG: hypothetical protein IJC43_07460 [Clostridia bacterium]|nr:hypothetical protein [Clostridia bacterium]
MKLPMSKILQIIEEILIIIGKNIPLSEAITGTAKKHTLPVDTVWDLWNRYGK